MFDFVSFRSSGEWLAMNSTLIDTRDRVAGQRTAPMPRIAA